MPPPSVVMAVPGGGTAEERRDTTELAALLESAGHEVTLLADNGHARGDDAALELGPAAADHGQDSRARGGGDGGGRAQAAELGSALGGGAAGGTSAGGGDRGGAPGSAPALSAGSPVSCGASGLLRTLLSPPRTPQPGASDGTSTPSSTPSSSPPLPPPAIFSNHRVWLVTGAKAAHNKSQLAVWRRKIPEYGGVLVDDLMDNPTVAVFPSAVFDSGSDPTKALPRGVTANGLRMVGCAAVSGLWVANCLLHKQLLDPAAYKVSFDRPAARAEGGGGGGGGGDVGGGGCGRDTPGIKARSRDDGSAVPATKRAKGAGSDGPTSPGVFGAMGITPRFPLLEEGSPSSQPREEAPGLKSRADLFGLIPPVPEKQYLMERRTKEEGEEEGHDEGFTYKVEDDANLNAHITGPLSEMMGLYEAIEGKSEAYHVAYYKKMITAFRGLPSRINSWEDVEKLKCFGKGKRFAIPDTRRTREKLISILETGSFEKLNELRKSPLCNAVSELVKVWGIGPASAQALYRAGFTSVRDLREGVVVKGAHRMPKLTAQQQSGLRYHEEIHTRIPREEVREIEARVKAAARALRGDLVCAQACGSYRRGKSSSKDVDVLVTHPDRGALDGLLPALIERLHSEGFITCDLSIEKQLRDQCRSHREDMRPERMGTYMGMCRLEGAGRVNRRLDIKVYEAECYPFALLYFTGSDHFNRSMRLWARNHDFSLDDTGLYPADHASGRKAKDGIACESEEAIFKALHLQYVPPTERNI